MLGSSGQFVCIAYLDGVYPLSCSEFSRLINPILAQIPAYHKNVWVTQTGPDRFHVVSGGFEPRPIVIPNIPTELSLEYTLAKMRTDVSKQPELTFWKKFRKLFT